MYELEACCAEVDIYHPQAEVNEAQRENGVSWFGAIPDPCLDQYAVSMVIYNISGVLSKLEGNDRLLAACLCREIAHPNLIRKNLEWK